MKSYQRLNAQPSSEQIETARRVANKIGFLGLVVITMQIGRSISITVQPTASTRLLRSVYTGQGWAAGRMYKSYAAVVDGIKIVWHKPMRAPSASNVIPWPGHGYRRAAR